MFNGTKVSEKAGKLIFLELIIGIVDSCNEDPILIFSDWAQMLMFAFLHSHNTRKLQIVEKLYRGLKRVVSELIIYQIGSFRIQNLAICCT